MSREVPCVGCGAKFLKLLPSSQGLCCRCREKERFRKHENAKGRPELLPGAFHTKADAHAYLDQDELTCLLCGWVGSGLYRHLPMEHGVTAREYKMHFGLPLTVGLIGRKGRTALACKAPVRSAKHLKKMHAARGHKQTAAPAYVVAERVLQMQESENHPSKQEGDVLTVCTLCGERFYQSAKVALAMQCRARCEACKRKRRK